MKLSILALALTTVACHCLAQETFYFSTILSGTNEVPPTATERSVKATFALTGNTMAYVSALGVLGGPPSLRGPASPGSNGPVISALDSYFLAPLPPHRPGGLSFFGELSLTQEQITYLFAGLLYVDNGVSRGQILLDSDLDFVPDIRDRCLGSPPGLLVDSDGCTLEQLCPCEAPWKGHGEYVSCMENATAKFVTEGLLTEERRLELLKQAAQSDCGKPQRN